MKPLRDDTNALTLRGDSEKRLSLLLSGNPRDNLDLIKLARFSDDENTASRATAAVIEMRLSMQMEIDEAENALNKAPDDEKLLRRLISTLSSALDSALFEEPALGRNRRALHSALKKAIALSPDAELLGLSVKNAVELKHYAEARSCAEREKRLYPRDERAWLDMLRVSVETRDRALLKETLEAIAKADVLWSDVGLERLRYWRDEK